MPNRHQAPHAEVSVDVSDKEVPEPWAARMAARGFTRTRGRGASVSALARAAGLSISTVSRAMDGEGQPSAETVDALTRILGPDVADWLGVPRTKEWAPPASAVFLTDRQRRAVEELINAMTEQSAATPPAPTAAVELVGRAARRGAPAFADRDDACEESQDVDEDGPR